jgi:hypothetical protein
MTKEMSYDFSVLFRQVAICLVRVNLFEKSEKWMKKAVWNQASL